MMHRTMVLSGRGVARPLIAVALLATLPASATAQDLGFLSGIFGRVHRMSLFLQSLDPIHADLLDRTGKGCLTLALCGAGSEVLVDLETPVRKVQLSLGFGAGYLRSIRTRTIDSIDIRGSLRTLPNVSTHVTYLLNPLVNPYFTGSFGLVDLWNGRAHNAAGRQTDVRAQAFEYGVSFGVGISPRSTNGRLILEAGYRARNFASIGYGFQEPLPRSAPRSLDLSGWQFNAGWQFDLRPLNRAPNYAGLWVLARAEGMNLPFALSQERSGAESNRTDLINGTLDMGEETYQMQLVTRVSTLSGAGVILSQRYPDLIREQGSWLRDGAIIRLARAGGGEASVAVPADDELIVTHGHTGRRLHFRRARR
ncbi:MAG: hypothetical protein ACT4OZ_06065 [Gemmatimonadota bacterium]